MLDIFDQELANYSPWAKYGPPPVFVNKVLSAHTTHIRFCVVYGCFVLPRLSGVVMTETVYTLLDPLHKKSLLTRFRL